MSENEQLSLSSAVEKTNQAPQVGAGNNQTCDEERGDLIQFYNSVFVLKVKGFAMQYAVFENHQVTTMQVFFRSIYMCVRVYLCFLFLFKTPNLLTGRDSAPFTFPLSPGTASFSSSLLSETLAVRLATQKLCRRPQQLEQPCDLLYQQKPFKGMHTHKDTFQWNIHTH